MMLQTTQQRNKEKSFCVSWNGMRTYTNSASTFSTLAAIVS